jgi:paraquat-inducible protein B
MQQIDSLAENFNGQTTPAITKALEQLSSTLAELEASLGNDSPVNYQLRQTMREMSMAVRSMRGLTDYLERHPESLLYGKEKEQP